MNESLNKLVEFTKNLTLMYVEDDQYSREQTLSILELFFDKIVIAVDGQDALGKYKKNRIDFIITDINMPHINGLKLVEIIRKTNKTIPIIIVSAHGDTDYFLESIKFGVDGYLIKPIESEQFIYQISKNLHNLYLENQIKDYHNNLEEQVMKQVKELREKDKILIQQTKLATMGEMMDIIAHQWKQPINIISMNSSLVWELYSEYDKAIKPKDIEKCYTSVKAQVNHLVKTLDDFRKFFRPNEIIESINLKSLIDSVLLLIHDELMKNLITIEIECDEKLTINANTNEIKHIFINLINNAKDAFNQNDIKNRKIIISCNQNEKYLTVDVSDNAGGIPNEIVKSIFEANFTTKSEIGGTGIGLYMSRFIAKKNNAKIDVQNIDDGAMFTVKFQKN